MIFLSSTRKYKKVSKERYLSFFKVLFFYKKNSKQKKSPFFLQKKRQAKKVPEQVPEATFRLPEQSSGYRLQVNGYLIVILKTKKETLFFVY